MRKLCQLIHTLWCKIIIYTYVLKFLLRVLFAKFRTQIINRGAKLC